MHKRQHITICFFLGWLCFTSTIFFLCVLCCVPQKNCKKDKKCPKQIRSTIAFFHCCSKYYSSFIIHRINIFFVRLNIVGEDQRYILIFSGIAKIRKPTTFITNRNVFIVFNDFYLNVAEGKKQQHKTVVTTD